MTEPIQDDAINALLEEHCQTIDSIIDRKGGEQLQHLFNEVYQSGLIRGLAEHPKYTRIDVEGRAGHFAIYKRGPDGNITTEVLTPSLELMMKTPADDFDLQISSAEQIFRFLENEEPTVLELDRYLRPFEHLMSEIPSVKIAPTKPETSLESVATEYVDNVETRFSDEYAIDEYQEDMEQLNDQINELVSDGNREVENKSYGEAALFFADAAQLQTIHNKIEQDELCDAITEIDQLDTALRDYIPSRLYEQIYEIGQQ